MTMDESPSTYTVPEKSEIDSRTFPEPEASATDSEDGNDDNDSNDGRLSREYYKSEAKYLIEKHELNEKTGRQNRVIICKKCDRTFLKLSNGIDHVRSHLKMKPF